MGTSRAEWGLGPWISESEIECLSRLPSPKGIVFFWWVKVPPFSFIFIGSVFLALPGFPSVQMEGLTHDGEAESPNLFSSIEVGSFLSRSIWSRHALSTRTCRWSWFSSGIKVIWACSYESKSWPNKGIGQSGMYRNLCCKYVFPIIHCNDYRKCWYSGLTVTPMTWTVCRRSPVIFSFRIK